jgi:hypothetical protein
MRVNSMADFEYKAFRERRNSAQRKWRLENPDKLKEYNKKRNAKNKNPLRELLKKQKEDRLNNYNSTVPSRICDKCDKIKPITEFPVRKPINGKEYPRRTCKKCSNEQNKKWLKTHPVEYKIIYSKRNLKARSSLDGRINNSMAASISHSLHGSKSNRKWENIVGYTLEQLKKHLEKQFLSGMTWGNYGFYGWHIDHKIPKSVFNYTTTKHVDFKKCWALKNLQPLWGKDNLSKNNRLDKPFQPSFLMDVI